MKQKYPVAKNKHHIYYDIERKKSTQLNYKKKRQELQQTSHTSLSISTGNCVTGLTAKSSTAALRLRAPCVSGSYWKKAIMLEIHLNLFVFLLLTLDIIIIIRPVLTLVLIHVTTLSLNFFSLFCFER